MFGGMGGFGGFDPFFFGEPFRSRKEEKEQRESFEKNLNLDKEITVTKDQFMETAAKVVTQGKFAKIMEDQKGIHTQFMFSLMVAPFIADLVTELFDKDEEDKEDGRE
jgi:hypothetical protein